MPPRLLRPARIALFAQALALLVVISLTIPSYLDYLTHPTSCQAGDLCLDLRDLQFIGATFFLGPPALLLLTTVWLWRRPRRWPAALPILVDVAVIGVVIIDFDAFSKAGSSEPNIVVQVLLGLVPAVVSLTLVVALLRRWDSGKSTPGAPVRGAPG